jgi:hypothetical protein
VIGVLPPAITELSVDLGVMAAILVAVVAIVRYGVIAPVRAFRRIESYAERAFTAIETVEREFKPNGGSSAKDALNRIEQRQERIEQRLDTLEQKEIDQ